MTRSYWDKVLKNRIARRRILQGGAGLGLSAAALVALGCGDDDDDDDGGSGAGGGDNGDAQPGGTLRFGLSSDLTSLEPHVFILAHGDSINQVWDTMTFYDENLQPQPWLAESWDINDNFTEIVLKLRQGVQFHSGRELTSEDVVFNTDRVRAEGTAFGQLRAFAALYDSIEAPDPTTVVFKSAIPRPATFDFFERFLIGDKDTLDQDATVAVGTGAFMLGEWRPGDQFNLLKNPNYWDSGRPLLDEQVYSVSLDSQTMVSQFEAGGLDVTIRPPIRDFVRFRDSSDYQALAHPTPGAYYAVGWNSVGSGGTPPEFRDRRVRQALNWALNREYFAETIMQGIVEPYALPWPESSVAYEEEKVNRYSFDLDKARELFAEAGVDPASLSFSMIMTPENAELQEFAQAHQADLAELGIKTEIEVVETAAFVERINGDPPNYNGMWVANASLSNMAAPITMVNFTNVLYGPEVGGEFEGVTYGDNNTGYYNPAWSDLVAAINSEGDQGRLEDLYSQMNDFLLDDSWIGFLATRPPRIALQGNIRGVTHWPARDGFRYLDAWIES